jgi:Family of unknown function (DUF6958)
MKVAIQGTGNLQKRHTNRTRTEAPIHMKSAAFLKILPTVQEIRERVVAHLSDKLFPHAARAGWWAKTVQLDLEPKGAIAREKSRPLRLLKR